MSVKSVENGMKRNAWPVDSKPKQTEDIKVPNVYMSEEAKAEAVKAIIFGSNNWAKSYLCQYCRSVSSQQIYETFLAIKEAYSRLKPGTAWSANIEVIYGDLQK